jgi:archaellum biogenesis ATPase FlaH
MSIERKILKHLILDDPYARQTLPFLKDEYFSDQTEKTLFDLTASYTLQYNVRPSVDALKIEAESIPSLNDIQFKKLITLIDDVSVPIEKDSDDGLWLIDQTEQFCKDKAVYNAIMQSITIMDADPGDKNALSPGSIPGLLSDALAVSFDNHIGHDFLDDAEARFESYHVEEQKMPFDLDFMNKITKGGLNKKTLNIILAGPGSGKSLTMCHFAAANLSMGKNVLYITMEMAEEKIAERIDANLLNTDLDDLVKLPKETYMKRMERVQSKTKGKLIIKEYPTASASTVHFKHLLNELHLKKKFRPDIIYIDYLNICCSARIKGGDANSYTLIKSIAEEIRGMAVEYKVPIWSATQTTRGGYESSDIELTDTSESFGLPATADLMIALISSDELADLKQLMIKQLKNRYSSPDTNKRFVVGIDKAKMRLYDVEDSAQSDIHKVVPKNNGPKSVNGSHEQPAFDKSDFGGRMNKQRDFGNFK